MRRIFAIFCLCVVISIPAIAGLDYPLQIRNKQEFFGGNLLVDTTGRTQSYLIKQQWLDNLETLSSWQGIPKSQEFGSVVNLEQTIYSFLWNQNLFVLGIKNKKYTLIQFDNKLSQLNSIYLTDFETQEIKSTPKFIQQDENTAYLLIENKLFQIKYDNNSFSQTEIFENIEDFTLSKNNIFTIETLNNYSILKKFDYSLTEIWQIRLESSEINSIDIRDNYIMLKSTSELSVTTLIQVLNTQTKSIILKRIFDINSQLFAFDIVRDNPTIFWISNHNDNYKINSLGAFSNNVINSASLPKKIYEPIQLSISSHKIIAIFRNSLLMFDYNLTIELFDFNLVGDKFSSTIEVKILKDHLMLSSPNYSEIHQIRENKFAILFTIYYKFLQYIVPLLLILLLYLYYRLYKKQKKIFNELLNLPSANIIIVLNSKGVVENISEKGLDLLGLGKKVPFKQSFHIFLQKEEFFPLLEFYEYSINSKTHNSKKITLIKNNNAFEYFFHISPYWTMTGKLKGYLINGFDITEQLERKKMANWAQLAHDMQTNLLTIKLNAEQIKVEENTDNFTRKNRILHQVNLLQKRVRDIVTVGRSNNLELVATNSVELLSEAASEFDKTAFPNITFQIASDRIELNCDKQKLIRAIRNTIENGIKALPNQMGLISLNSWIEGRMICFSIKDNGIGIDEHAKKKILTPYFSTAKDGSGFGIGTIIIQQVVELHSGKIIINSEKNKGTEFILKIPRNLK